MCKYTQIAGWAGFAFKVLMTSSTPEVAKAKQSPDDPLAVFVVLRKDDSESWRMSPKGGAPVTVTMATRRIFGDRELVGKYGWKFEKHQAAKTLQDLV